MYGELMSFAALRSVWPGIDAFDKDEARFKVREANRIVAAEPGVIERVENKTLDIEVVHMVIERMVRRNLQRSTVTPFDGVASQSFTSGPYGGQISFHRPDNGDLYLTKQDRKLLGVVGTVRRAFSTFQGGIR